ncbi:hypothetical protein AAE478_002964 [Parahypoxylon ruwenzoriense]
MVLCHLHLISLRHGASVAAFLAKLRRHGIAPLVQARVVRWIVLPTYISAGHLLGRNIRWDLFLVLEGEGKGEIEGDDGGSLPPEARRDIEALWSASCAVSSKALRDYASVNASLLHPRAGSVSPPEHPTVEPSATSQNLEMSLELGEWIAGLPVQLREHPVSMLNLLAFRPGRKDAYKKYGTAFRGGVGSRHGGRVKIVGRVMAAGGQTQAYADGWDEIAFVGYPSIQHFAAMAASADYQDANHRYRLPALEDTFILCVMEVDNDGIIVNNHHSSREKL